MVEGGMTCVKYLLFAFNFLFFVIGLALVICGTVIQSSFREYFDIIGEQFSSAAALLIAVGCIIFIIGFFGCCGAVKEHYCMVLTFAVLLAIIFVLEIAVGVTAYNMQDQVEGVLETELRKSVDDYRNATATNRTWDAMQRNLRCCGVDQGAADWTGKVGDGLVYPRSCCKKGELGNANCGTDLELAYTLPCVKTTRVFIENNLMWVCVIGVCMALVQITGIVFACCLARTIHKEYHTV